MHKTIADHVDYVEGGPQRPVRLAVAARPARLHEGHQVGSAVTGITQRHIIMPGTPPMAARPHPGSGRLRERARDQLRAFATLMERLDVVPSMMAR